MEALQQNSVPTPRYRLRWRFDFAQKPTKFGIWNGAGNPSDGAWKVNKDGLVRAAVEGEDIFTYETRLLAEVQGSDYATCEWDAYTRIPGFYKSTQPINPRVYIAGMSLVSREERLTVFVDGTIGRRPLTDEEKQFKKLEHSI